VTRQAQASKGLLIQNPISYVTLKMEAANFRKSWQTSPPKDCIIIEEYHNVHMMVF
jgi:hypothetical protein